MEGFKLKRRNQAHLQFSLVPVTVLFNIMKIVLANYDRPTRQKVFTVPATSTV